MFQPGQRVLCLRAEYAVALYSGHVYKVARYFKDLYLNGAPHAKIYIPRVGDSGPPEPEWRGGHYQLKKPQLVLMEGDYPWFFDADRFVVCSDEQKGIHNDVAAMEHCWKCEMRWHEECDRKYALEEARNEYEDSASEHDCSDPLDNCSHDCWCSGDINEEHSCDE